MTEAQASEQPRSILVVEDEQDLRELLAEELSDSGYRVREAANGIEALEAIKASPPHLVLSDITMPGMDGHQLLSEVRATVESMEEVPFIFLSALADKDDMMKGLDLGADDYITKPVDFDLLIAKIESRFREISRMQEKREKQLVKLYKAMAPTGAADEAAAEPPAEPVAGPASKAGTKAVAETAGSTAPAPAAQSSSFAAADCPIAKQVRRANGEVVAGRFQLVNQGRIQKQSGDGWNQRSKQIFKLADEVLQARLDKNDVVRRSGANDFIVCFTSLPEAEATSKSNGIAHELNSKLQSHAEQGIVPDFRADVETLVVSDEEIEACEGIIGALSARLTQMAYDAKANATAVLKEVTESGDIELADVYTRRGQLAPFKLPRLNTATMKTANRLIMGTGDAAPIDAETDSMILSRVGERFLASSKDRPQIVSTTLHLPTARHKTLAQRYLNARAQLPDEVKQRLMLVVSGGTIDQLLAKGIMESLSSLAKLTVVEVSEPKITKDDIVRLKASMIAISYTNLMGCEAEQELTSKAFANQIHKAGAKLLVYDVPSRHAAGLNSIGADFRSMVA